jgi:hypothetical protein
MITIRETCHPPDVERSILEPSCPHRANMNMDPRIWLLPHQQEYCRVLAGPERAGFDQLGVLQFSGIAGRIESCILPWRVHPDVNLRSCHLRW